MNKVRIREEINQYLEKADDRFIQLVYGLIKADQSAAIGYTPHGAAISKEEIIARAERSEKDIREGRIKSLSDIREQIKHW